MNVIALGSLLVLLVVSSPAGAETYRCRQPDGSVSFQDRPCPAGAGTVIPVSPAAGAAGAMPAASQDQRQALQEQVRDADRERHAREARAHDAETAAFQGAQRCNAARQQLGVLKEGLPVFSRDNAGERHYIDDKERSRATAQAQQRVADACP